MAKEKRILALIPARGGSKRFPQKNIKTLGGRPLIDWTVKAALNSSHVSRVVVSTDCEGIRTAAEQSGAEVPFLRPQELSTDTSTTNSVIMHALEYMGPENFDYVVLLQPTSPLRTSADIDSAFHLLERKNACGVVSVSMCEHSPLWCSELPEDGSMEGFFKPEVFGLRSQDLPDFYRINGAIYLYLTDSLVKNSGIHYNEGVYAYKMPKERSVDIDTYDDFLLAEQYIARGGIND